MSNFTSDEHRPARDSLIKNAMDKRTYFLLQSASAITLRRRPNSDFLYYENLGAYGVRYLFVIYGFLVAGTENLRGQFLLGRALEATGSEPF